MAKKDKENKEKLEKVIEEAKEEDVELEVITKKDESIVKDTPEFEAPRKRK
tara:strand:+ start:742 stop:894 length:153 start_codon:yes stop_codon:yes gene_type:complete